jgi:hypothetical protein
MSTTKFILLEDAGAGKSSLARKLLGLAGTDEGGPVVVHGVDSLGSTKPALYGNIVDTPGLNLDGGLISATAPAIKKLIGKNPCVLVLLIEKSTRRILPEVMGKFQKLASSLQGDAYKVVVVYSHEGGVRPELQEAVARQLGGHVLQYLNMDDTNIAQTLLATEGIATPVLTPKTTAKVTTTTTIEAKVQAKIQAKAKAKKGIKVDLDAPYMPKVKIATYYLGPTSKKNTNYTKIFHDIIIEALEMRIVD